MHAYLTLILNVITLNKQQYSLLYWLSNLTQKKKVKNKEKLQEEK